MAYQLYNNSKSAWQNMWQDLNQAKHFIFLEFYIFLDDTGPEFNFVDILINKAKAGLKIAMVLDYLGSWYLSRLSRQRLREAGVEIIFRRTHRKIVVIDNKIAFLGGVNVKQATKNWHDLQLRIDKPEIVKQVSQTFATVYRMYGGQDPYILKFIQNQELVNHQENIYHNNPRRKKFSISSYYYQKIRTSQKHIIMATPYFTPPKKIIHLLFAAVNRGVKVEIIVPRKTDWHFIDFCNQAYLKKISALGIDVYYLSSMNHTKMALFDDKEFFVGSPNLDIVSSKLTLEIGIALQDKDVIYKLKQIVQSWKDSSQLIKPFWRKPRWVDIVVMRFVGFLYTVL